MLPASAQARSKILVVDDLPLNRKLLSAMARKLGYDTIEAENGAQCLDLYARERDRISCILLDLQMPVLDGWQTAQRLRLLDEAHSRRTPIVACTACNLGDMLDLGKSVEEHTLSCGVDTCLSKPLTFAVLAQVISTLALTIPSTTSMLMQSAC